MPGASGAPQRDPTHCCSSSECRWCWAILSRESTRRHTRCRLPQSRPRSCIGLPWSRTRLNDATQRAVAVSTSCRDCQPVARVDQRGVDQPDGASHPGIVVRRADSTDAADEVVIVTLLAEGLRLPRDARPRRSRHDAGALRRSRPHAFPSLPRRRPDPERSPIRRRLGHRNPRGYARSLLEPRHEPPPALTPRIALQRRQAVSSP